MQFPFPLTIFDGRLKNQGEFFFHESISDRIESAIELGTHIVRNACYRFADFNLGIIPDKIRQVFICLTQAIQHGETPMEMNFRHCQVWGLDDWGAEVFHTSFLHPGRSIKSENP
jgi:hypothetical protein